MKHSGICPKCGNSHIVSVPFSAQLNNNPKIHGSPTLVPCPNTYFTCSSCGFVEEWGDPDEFKRFGVAEYWQNKKQKELEFDELDAYWRKKLKETKLDK